MADLAGIGQMLQGIGAGFSGQGPQYMMAQQQQQEADALKDERRRKALLTDFATGFSMLNNGQTEQATKLFQNRLEMLQKLRAPDMSDTQGIVDRLVSGDPAKIEEVKTGIGSIIQGAILTGELKPESSGVEGAKGNQFFKNGAVLQAASDRSLTLTTPTGVSITPSDPNWQQAISEATSSGIQYAGNEAAARAMGQGNVQLQLDPVIAELVSRAQAGVEGETKPQIEQNTQKAKLLVDRANARLETGLTSASALPSLYRMSELLDTVNTGGFANVTAKAQSMFGVLPKDTAELQNLMGRNVLSQLKASFGGNPTEREGAFLAEIEASLNKGTGANKATIDNAIKLLELRAQNGKKAAKYLEDQDSADEIDGYLKLKLGDKPTEKKVVRRGVDKATGKRVVQYDDGTVVPE